MKSTETMPQSLWAAVTKPPGAYPTLVGPKTCDVVVVGGGFTGLSAALHLRRAGLNTIVIEAAEPGWGASGRNNGQVIPTLSRLDPDVIVERYRAAGERFVTLVRDSAQLLFDVIRDERIAAESEQNGWVQPVHTPGRMALAERRVAQWTRFGAKVALLDRQDLARKLGQTPWHGGWWAPTGGHLNPLSFARGLARAVTDRGGTIYAQSPALSFGRAGPRWVVTTTEGRVDARALVVATNALTGHFSDRLAPTLARELINVTSWQVATTPIPDDVRPLVMPDRCAVSDTRGELRFARYDARNRIVTGTAILGQRNAEARLKPLLSKRLIEMFPALARVQGGLQFDYVWNGPIGMTRDAMPRMHVLGPDGFAWLGCNGRGVALSVAIGREFARGILGAPRSELALPFTEPEPIRFHSIANRLAPLKLFQLRREDGLELPPSGHAGT